MFCIAFLRAIAATMLTVFFDALRIALFESAIAAAKDDTTLTFIFFASKKTPPWSCGGAELLCLPCEKENNNHAFKI